MRVPRFLKPNLQRLVLAVVILTAVAMLATAFHASYRVQRQVLIDSALESNHAYSAKLAESAEGFLHAAKQQLAYSAQILGRGFDDETLLLREGERLWLQTDSFNSVGITDAQGVVRATAPRRLHLVGQVVQSAEAQRALEQRIPLVSSPYQSSAGNLIVFLSHPIFSPAGEYLGYVGGAIYLKHENILNSLLGKHYYRDGSYIYVVDQTRRLLYHPDPVRIGTTVANNLVVDEVLSGKSGSDKVVNSQGVGMLAGFAPVPSAGWGIVAQRPMESTLEPLNGLMLNIVARTAPIALLALLAVWALARYIARPLSLLARQARHSDTPQAAEQIRAVRSWYFEAAELKRAMLIGIGLLQQKLGVAHQDAQTDPLTGLLNRRGLGLVLESFKALGRPFSVLALDIDHFKRVNDTYGHDVGDLVLQELAAVLRSESRPSDLLCRNGGEEFIVLLPDIPEHAAVAIAERLRQKVEAGAMPHGDTITVSLGVSHWPGAHRPFDEVLRQADQALYRAKRSGRNQVVCASEAAEAH